MNTDNTTHNPSAGWRILGELELPVGANVEDALYAWLTEILHPLNLEAELLRQIVESAQDAVARTIQTETTLKMEHVHITVFVPSKHEAWGHAWGFFRVEKFEDAKDEQTGSDHAVEFYLYGEGD